MPTSLPPVRRSPLRLSAGFAARHPVLALSLAFGCCLLAATGIATVHLETQITALLPKGHASLERFRIVAERFGSADLLAFAVEVPENADAETWDQARQHIDRIASVAESWNWTEEDGTQEDMIVWMDGRPNPEAEAAFQDLLIANSWLFLHDDSVETMVKRLDPARLASRMRRPSASIPASLHDRDPLGLWTRAYLPFWEEQIGQTLPLKRDGDYLRSRSDRYLVLVLQARHPASHSTFTMAIAQAMRQLLYDDPHYDGNGGTVWDGMPVHCLGPYFVAERDYNNATNSAWLSMLGSLGGVLTLFALAYRSMRLPALITIALMPAVAAALGLSAYILGGSLTMIVSAFAAILIGLGVDFVIHLYNGYSWALDRLRQRLPIDTPRQRKRLRALAAIRASEQVGPGVIAAGLTTVGTFLVLLLSHYRGLQELGAICGLGLLLILIQLLLVVPAFLTVLGPTRSRASQLLAPFSRSILTRPKLWGGGMVTLIVATVVFLGMQPQIIQFDRDPRNLRPAEDGELRKNIELSGKLGLLDGGHQVLLRGDNPEAVLQAAEIFMQRVETLAGDDSISFTTDIDFAALAAGAQIAKLPLSDPNRDPAFFAGRRSLLTDHGRLRFDSIKKGALINVRAEPQMPITSGTIPAGTPVTLLGAVKNTFHPLSWFASPARQRQRIDDLSERIDWAAMDEAIRDLDPELAKQRAPFLADLQAMQRRITDRRALMPAELLNSPLAPLVGNAWYVDPEGVVLLRVPLHLNHRAGQAGFDEILTGLGLPVDGEWTTVPGTDVSIGTAGPPSIAHVLQHILISDFRNLSSWAALVTILLLTLCIRHLVGSLQSLFALVSGLLVGLAVMHLTGMQWNLMNIAVLPLVIGIGIDNGIHFVHALRHAGGSREDVGRVITQIGHPILITALTSIIGFGSLLLNAYQGVQSVGLTAVIGIAACLVVSLVGLPLLALLGVSRRQKRAEQSPE